MAELQKGEKRLFLTVGATAPFNRLVSAVLQPAFLTTLSTHNFSHLRIQHGTGGAQTFNFFMDAVGDRVQKDMGVAVSGFDYEKSGLQGELAAVKESGGTVISHAGSGSILDCLRVGVPVVVVPNGELMDDHQVELAEVLAEQEYVVYGTLDSLDESILKAEELRKRMKQWPPPNSGTEKYKDGLKGVIAEEMGWVD